MDASPEVLEAIGVTYNIYEDDTMTPDGGNLILGQAMLPTASLFRKKCIYIRQEAR